MFHYKLKQFYNNAAFSLIELMIVIAIVGILAAIAIPAYQNYLIRARVTDMLTALDPIKQGMAEYRTIQGSFPANLAALQALGLATGDLTQVSSVIGSYSVAQYATTPSANGKITITSTNTIGVPSNGTITLTLGATYNDAGIAWDCYTDTLANLIYVPDKCRKLWSSAVPTY